MAGGIEAAGLIMAGIYELTLTETTLVGIANTTIHAGAFIATRELNTLGVDTTRVCRAATIQRLTFGGRVTKEIGWAGTLSLAIDHSALGIGTAGSILQAWITALSLIAAFAGLAVVILTTLKLDALLARFTFIPIGAVTQHAMFRNGAESITSASSIIGTRVCTLSIDTTLIRGTISVRLATGNARASFTKLPQRALTLGATLVAALSSGTLLSTGAVFGTGALGSAISAAFITFTTRMTTLWRQMTARESITYEGGRTLALYAVIDDQTVGTLSTLSWSLAGILAFFIDTSLIAAAAKIVATSRLTDAILTNLSLGTGAVRVANGTASATHTTFIGKTVLVISALALATSCITQLI